MVVVSHKYEPEGTMCLLSWADEMEIERALRSDNALIRMNGNMDYDRVLQIHYHNSKFSLPDQISHGTLEDAFRYLDITDILNMNLSAYSIYCNALMFKRYDVAKKVRHTNRTSPNVHIFFEYLAGIFTATPNHAIDVARSLEDGEANFLMSVLIYEAHQRQNFIDDLKPRAYDITARRFQIKNYVGVGDIYGISVKTACDAGMFEYMDVAVQQPVNISVDCVRPDIPFNNLSSRFVIFNEGDDHYMVSYNGVDPVNVELYDVVSPDLEDFIMSDYVINGRDEIIDEPLSYDARYIQYQLNNVHASQYFI